MISSISGKKIVWGIGGVALVGAVVWWTGFRDGSDREAPPVIATRVEAGPKEGFDLVRQVAQQGGTSLEIDAAIEHLDTATRTRTGLRREQRQWLIEALSQGKPAKMSGVTWAHFFNSSCNAIAAGGHAAEEPLIALLIKVAEDDPSKVLRLFSLQHLGKNYRTADPARQKEIRALVIRTLQDPDADTAGTALVLWRRWEKESPETFSTLDTGLTLAANRNQSTDIRVSALHVAGESPECLPLARSLAGDRKEPILLRKAALYLIGVHGDASDLPLLKTASSQNPRLGQAGRPAAETLQARLDGIRKPNYQPYR